MTEKTIDRALINEIINEGAEEVLREHGIDPEDAPDMINRLIARAQLDARYLIFTILGIKEG